jgi:hypothetical protein
MSVEVFLFIPMKNRGTWNLSKSNDYEKVALALVATSSESMIFFLAGIR